MSESLQFNQRRLNPLTKVVLLVLLVLLALLAYYFGRYLKNHHHKQLVQKVL